mmetsp:Transcript_12687/g.43820  ORF Transcript_12687/g.43820 Transcript_12687/m.43820 type:complete len:486 (-) Transcript_12687:66-1523(-)
MARRAALEVLLEACALQRLQASAPRLTDRLRELHGRLRPEMDPTVYESSLQRIALEVDRVGHARIDRIADACGMLGFVEAPKEYVRRRFVWRDGFLVPDAGGEGETLRAWIQPTKSEHVVHGGFLAAEDASEAVLATLARGVERHLLEPVAQWFDGRKRAVEDSFEQRRLKVATAARHTASRAQQTLEPVADGYLRLKRRQAALIAEHRHRFTRPNLQRHTPEAAPYIADAAPAAAALRPLDVLMDPPFEAPPFEVPLDVPFEAPLDATALLDDPARLLDVIVAQRSPGDAEPRCEAYVRVPANALAALAPRGAFALRQRDGARFIAAVFLAAAAAPPAYRTFKFAGDWAATSEYVGQAAVVICAASLAYGAYRGLCANRDRLLLALEKTTRLHRGATGYAAVSDHCDALVAKATAKQALKLFLDTAEGRAARGEARPALQAAARDLLFSTGLFAPDGTPLSAAAAKNALCTYVDHAPATPAQRR